MITNEQIQIHFPLPGEWSRFTLTALWQDCEGYDCRRTYEPADIPEPHSTTLRVAVAGLVGLDAPWQATHVAATLQTPGAGEAIPEAVCLTLNARRADGACRIFTWEDYPQLQLTEESAISAFRYLAGGAV